jgi:hypothetical protein
MVMNTDVITKSFYFEGTITNTSYASDLTYFVDNKTGKKFYSSGILIANDSDTDDVMISFGKDQSGNWVDDARVKAGEIVSFDRRIEEGFNVKTLGGGVFIRVWAW